MLVAQLKILMANSLGIKAIPSLGSFSNEIGSVLPTFWIQVLSLFANLIDPVQFSFAACIIPSTVNFGLAAKAGRPSPLVEVNQLALNLDCLILYQSAVFLVIASIAPLNCIAFLLRCCANIPNR